MNKFEPKGTQKGTHIWVKEVYFHEIERHRKTSLLYLRVARVDDSNNPDIRVKPHLRVDKLVINSQAFYVDNINKLPNLLDLQ